MSRIQKIVRNPYWPIEALLRRYGNFIQVPQVPNLLVLIDRFQRNERVCPTDLQACRGFVHPRC